MCIVDSSAKHLLLVPKIVTPIISERMCQALATLQRALSIVLSMMEMGMSNIPPIRDLAHLMSRLIHLTTCFRARIQTIHTSGGIKQFLIITSLIVHNVRIQFSVNFIVRRIYHSIVLVLIVVSLMRILV